jgi:hypothetical protein
MEQLMNHKIVISGIALLFGTTAFAGPVPKAVQARYAELKKVMTVLNFKGFSEFFAPEFVNVDQKGKSTPRTEFLAEVKPLFDSATKGDPNENLISATTHGGIVDVKFDFVLKLTGKTGVTTVHEVGVDSWKLVNKKWLMVKTVDTKFDVTTWKPAKKSSKNTH